MHGGMPEPQLQRVLALEVWCAWTEALASVGALFPADMRRRTAKSTLQQFVDRNNIHGSLPIVSENNTGIKRMVSNAENQVLGRGTAGNQALRRALRNPSFQVYDVHLPKFKLKPTLLHVCRSCDRGVHVRCYLLVFSAVVVRSLCLRSAKLRVCTHGFPT